MNPFSEVLRALTTGHLRLTCRLTLLALDNSLLQYGHIFESDDKTFCPEESGVLFCEPKVRSHLPDWISSLLESTSSSSDSDFTFFPRLVRFFGSSFYYFYSGYYSIFYSSYITSFTSFTSLTASTSFN